VAIIEHIFPNEDDPIFSGEFTVSFPIRLENSTKPSANDTDEESASDTSEAEPPS
jgi:hypothetical protein